MAKRRSCIIVHAYATEIFIEQPHIPELQKMTFSSYKNHNTCKALFFSPSGTITFHHHISPSGTITLHHHITPSHFT